MPRTFDNATPELESTVASVMRRYHSRLLEPQIERSVRVETLLVYGPRNKDGDQTGPAIKVHGCSAYACIRITTLEERVAGRSDAVMWIDGDGRKTWPPQTLEAIIDHELTHLELCECPKSGEIQFDDAGCVKLKLRPHDFQVGWFDEVAERHPNSSIETKQACALANSRQMYFPGFDLQPRKRRA